MADEIVSIIACVRKETHGDEEKVGLVNSYLDIVEQTVQSQHQIITNYEELVKKLELQITQCQIALDESTKREIEQISLIMELKLANATKDADEDDDKECETCQAYEKENELLTEQNAQQQQIIEKLGQAQELLMLQYKMLELGMDKELLKIAQTQQELNALKAEGAKDDDDDDEDDEEDGAADGEAEDQDEESK